MLECTTPNGAAPVGLVELACGNLCVIELDPDGLVPLMEDFSADESEIAYRHYQDRVRDLSDRANWATQARSEEMIAQIMKLDASKPMPAFL